MFFSRHLLLYPLFTMLLFHPLLADFEFEAAWHYGQGIPAVTHVFDAVTDSNEQFLYTLGTSERGDQRHLAAYRLPEDDEPDQIQVLLEDQPDLIRAEQLFISSDDRHLYVTLIDEDYQPALAIYARQNDGTLQFSSLQYTDLYMRPAALIAFSQTGNRVFAVNNSGALTVMNRDSRDGRLSLHRSYDSEPNGLFRWDKITHWQWLPDRNMLLAYSPQATALALIQFNTRGEKTSTRFVQVHPDYLQPGAFLNHCQFSSDGRLVLLAGSPTPSVYQLYLDLDRGTLADFRFTDLGEFNDVGYGERDYWLHTSFDEQSGYLLLFTGVWDAALALEIGFPFGPTERRSSGDFRGRETSLGDFFLSDGRYITFPGSGLVEIMEKQAGEGGFSVSHTYNHYQHNPLPRNPVNVVVAPNGGDVYVSDGSSGLFHLKQNPEDGTLTRVSHITCPSSGGNVGAAYDNQFLGLLLSEDGRFLYVGNRIGLRVLERDPETGRLWLIQRLPFRYNTSWSIRTFSFTTDQQQIAAFNRFGHGVIYDRNEDTGEITFRQTVNVDPETDMPVHRFVPLTLAGNDWIFVGLANEQVVVWQRQPDQSWVERGLVNASTNLSLEEEANELNFDLYHQQLWQRTGEGFLVFQWNPDDLSLTYVDGFLLDPLVVHPPAPHGPLLFDGDRAFFGDRIHNKIHVLHYDGAQWQPGQEINNHENGFHHLNGLTALTLNPVDGRLLATASTARAVTVLNETVRTHKRQSANKRFVPDLRGVVR